MWDIAKIIIGELEKLVNAIGDSSYKQRNSQFIKVNPVAVKSIMDDVTIGPVLINTKNIKYVWDGDHLHPSEDKVGCTIEMNCGAKFRLREELHLIHDLFLGLD